MTVQLSETQFAWLVRLLSSDRLFRYPEEVDPGLAETFRAPQLQIEAEEGQEAPQSGNPEKVTRPPEKQVYLVDWYGPQDPENPQNWPSKWKLFITAQICILNFTVYVASSIYVPGQEDIMHEFQVGEVVATLGLSLFTLGYGLGPMLWSPMSEMPTLGRRSIYVLTLLLFVLFQLPTGFATNMTMLCVFRFITGFLSSPALATGGATISDMYKPALVPYGICIWGALGLLGPVAGPLLGGFIAPARGWRWTIWTITWLNAAVFLLLFFCMPETSSANILHKRAARLRKATSDARYRSATELAGEHQTWVDHLRTISRACTLTFTEPIVFALDLYTALLYGILFIWFESFPFVFNGIYHFSTQQQGLAFLGILVGALISVPLFLLWIRRGMIPAISSNPRFRPEMVLPPTFVGSVCLPLCLFWYGWSSRASVHWMVPIAGSGFFSVSIVTLFNPVLTYLGMTYPGHAASVFAGNTLFRASFGAVFPLFARQLFRSLGVGPGNSLLAGVSILFIPMPWLFYHYGPRIREMSRNARHDD